jgi:hypothetical protein
LSENNIKTIVRYIAALRTETSLSTHYRRDIIDLLTKFAIYHNNNNNNNKQFKDVTRDDVINFLNSFRRTEAADPLHKWIGTYNLFRIYLLRFFRWLYAPNIEHSKRPKPAIMENIVEQKRKEISIYKPSDLWTPADDLLFLKYCPSKRDKCYHAISRDLSARPHEILKLNVGDATFKNLGTSQYCEVTVNGKTGQRTIPLINSIPYLKDYLDHEHPMPNNPNAPLSPSFSRIIYNLPTDRATLHNIRLKFQVQDIWSRLSSRYPELPVRTFLSILTSKTKKRRDD